MIDNILKKVLIIGILLLFVSASGIYGIGVDNLSNIEMTSTEDLSNIIISRGDPYFIMLSDYTDGAGDKNLWALQLRFDGDLGIVESEYDDKYLPLITDQWVELKINIDLNIDWMEIYYNGSLLHQKHWSDGPDNTGDGIVNISAVDLFSDSTVPIYFDDFSLEEVGGGVIWSENFDSYEDESSMHGQGGWKGWDNDSNYTAYVTSVIYRSSPHSLDVRARADLIREYFGNYSGEFVYTTWVFFTENVAPNAPVITGPESGAVGYYYEYNFVTTDINSDDVYLFIEWGDGNIEEWIGPYESGEEVKIAHMWSDKGEYKIRAKARDKLEFESDWSKTLNVIISNPPNEPTITGPPNVKEDVEFEFIFNSTDPDGDLVKYYVDWGDNNNKSTGYYSSGTNVKIKHTWEEKGNFTIKAKAIDIYDVESNWSTFEIIVPRERQFYFNFNLLSLLFERYPNLFRFIRCLIGLKDF